MKNLTLLETKKSWLQGWERKTLSYEGREWEVSNGAMSSCVPAAGREHLCGGMLEILGQERVKCIHFPFLINVSDSCWLSRHNPIAAVSAGPLNVAFVATQRPRWRAQESSCSVWDLAMDFPGDRWLIAYLPHLRGRGNHPSLPQLCLICIRLYHVDWVSQLV